MVLLLSVLLAAGCIRSKSGELIRAEGRVPIGEEVISDSPQQRMVPWSDLVLEAGSRYSLSGPPDAEVAAASRGLRLALARVEARERAREELALKLAKLPAGEAPPGESGELTVLDFARRRAMVDAAVRGELEGSVTEEVLQDPSGEGAIVLKLPLKAVASTLLLHGGGFRQEAALVKDVGPRARANAQANRIARDELVKKVLLEKVDGKKTFREWIEEDQANRALFLSALEQARVVRSEAVTRRGAGTEWLAEMEFDTSPIVEAVKKGKESAARPRDGSATAPEMKTLKTTTTPR
jgi:hypothetical protein